MVEGEFDAAQREWADLWNPLPKVVFARTLATVQGAARWATASLAEEIERLRATPGKRDIAIGGPTLAAEALHTSSTRNSGSTWNCSKRAPSRPVVQSLHYRVRR